MKQTLLLSAAALLLTHTALTAQNIAPFPQKTMHKPARTARAAAKDLPVLFGPADQAEFNTYIVIDANNDEKTWKYEKDYTEGGTMCYESMGAPGGADDYVILPAVNFPMAGSYDITFKAKQLYRPESFQIGVSRSGSKDDYISLYECNSVPNSYSVMSAQIAIPEAGVWHPVVRATSAAAGLSLYVTQLEIKEPQVVTYSIPFYMEPTASESTAFTFVDANGDGKCWNFDSSNTALAYEYHAQNDADDYAILPAITISDPGRYRFSFDARGVGQNTETFQIMWGDSADPLQMQTIYSGSVTGSTVVNHGVTVEVNSPGDYRFAIRCTSPANRFKLIAKNFRVDVSHEALPVSLPATFVPDAEAWETFTTVGAWSQEGQEAVASIGAEADAWLFTPGFMTGDAPYLMYNLTARTANETVPVTVEMYIGHQPSVGAMKKVATTDGFVSTSLSEIERRFGALLQEGTAYMGLRLSSAQQTSVHIASIQVNEAADSGDAHVLPFSIQPTEDEFTLFRVINANDDESTWTYYAPFGAARYNYNLHNDADDWLVLPAVTVDDTSHLFHFSLNTRGMSSNKIAEYFEVWAGETSEPSAMTRIYTSGPVLTEVFSNRDFYFSLPATGTRYFAIRAISPKNSFHLFVRDFNIIQTERSVQVPAAPTVESITAGEMGALQATLSVKMPETNAAGHPLAPSVPIQLTVSSGAASATTSGLPGQLMSVTVATVQGDNTIRVLCNNAAGEGLDTFTSIYTGQDVPAPVNDIRVSVSEDNRTMHVEWTPQTIGANGGYVDPSMLTYELQHSYGTSYGHVATLNAETQYDYTIPDSYPLQVHYMRVVASNIAGTAENGRGTGAVMGKPYEIPMSEDFSSGEIYNGPVMIAKPTDDYRAQWYFDNPGKAFDESGNDSGRAMIAFTEDYGYAGARLVFPKVSTVGVSGARVVVRVYNYPSFPTTTIYAETYGTAPVEIGRIEPDQTAQWHEYTFPLPDAVLSRPWMDWYADVAFPGVGDDEIFMLDKYGVALLHDTDVELRRLSSPVIVRADETMNLSALLLNNGMQTVTLTTPRLGMRMPDGHTRMLNAENTPENLTLRFGESVTLDYSFETTIDDMGMIPFTLEADVPADANPDDNTITGGFEVRPDYEFTVFDLAAAVNNDKVTLTWSMPMLDEGIMNVEYLDAFDYGEQLGLWRNVDRDGRETLSFQTAAFPGMGKPKAWQVFNYAQAYFPDIYCGNGGSPQCFLAIGPNDGSRADDWLISPEVKGGSDVRFYVRPLNYAYGSERFEVLASDGGTDPADFTSVQQFTTIAGVQGDVPVWEEVNITLPDTARHFAIRYYSQDIFGLMLDDITYTPALQTEDPMAYNIYRDDTRIADSFSDYSYEDTPGNGQFRYNVALTADGKEYHRSVTAHANVTSEGVNMLTSGVRVHGGQGVITVTGAEGLDIKVTDPSGLTCIDQTALSDKVQYRLPQGIYLLRIGHVTCKAVVK